MPRYADRRVAVHDYFAQKWQRFASVLRTGIGFFPYLSLSEATDGSHRRNKKQLVRRLLGFFRSLFVKQPVAEILADMEGRKEYPRLELPIDFDVDFEYNMNHENRGFALIFNHEHFLDKRKSRRNATDIDRDKIARVLKRLHFKVKICNDLTFDEIENETSKVASMNHENNDCLMIVIMSHGEYGTISSFDGDYLIEDIASYFTDVNCPSLVGKPRLFFIQACRGSALDAGYQIPLSGYGSMEDKYQSNPLSSDIDVGDAVAEGADEFEEFVHIPPNHRDYLFVRTAMPGYLSFRSPTRGSWFIQDLCSELEAYGTTLNMLDLLTNVNRKVSERESQGPYWMNRKKQILCISSMLTKVLRLNNKE